MEIFLPLVGSPSGLLVGSEFLGLHCSAEAGHQAAAMQSPLTSKAVSFTFSPELLSSCPSLVLWHRHMARPSPAGLHLECSELLHSIALRTAMAQLQCVQNEPRGHQSMPKEMQLAHFYPARSQSLIQHAYFIFLSYFFFP